MMDLREKLYTKASRENKKSVDLANKKIVAKRKLSELRAAQNKKKEKNNANAEEPFYIRLINKDNQYQTYKK